LLFWYDAQGLRGRARYRLEAEAVEKRLGGGGIGPPVRESVQALEPFGERGVEPTVASPLREERHVAAQRELASEGAVRRRNFDVAQLLDRALDVFRDRRREDLAAVFRPIPETSVMLSTGSPARARRSVIWSAARRTSPGRAARRSLALGEVERVNLSFTSCSRSLPR